MSDTPWERVISTQVLLELYASRMEKYGGDPSGPRPGCLEGCLGNAWTAESYRLGDEEDTLRPGLTFAAYLLYYLAHDHCFADGNKRVAWSAMIFVMGYWGLTIDAITDEAEAFMLDVVGKKLDQDDAVIWIAERLQSIQ